MKTDAKHALIDPDYTGHEEPYVDQLDYIVDGSHVYGEIYVPGGIYEGKHPCVLLFHGIPGLTVNDDVGQALRRMGCVVIRVFHRGAWGSEGYYSFSNCIEDGKVLLDLIHSEAYQKYDIDYDNVFLAGHSNGGNTTINIAKEVKSQLRGIILMAPFNHASIWNASGEKGVQEFCESEGYLLHRESDTSLFEDSKTNYKEWDFSTKADVLSDVNMIVQVGTYDTAAPEETNVAAFWNALNAIPSDAVRVFKRYPSAHGFCSSRQKLIQDIADFIQSVVK